MKQAPPGLDFQKIIDLFKKGAQTAQAVVDNAEKVIAKAGGCKTDKPSSVPTINFSFTTNAACCPDPNCVKQLYKGSLDASFNLGTKKCNYPFVLLAVPMEAVFKMGLSGSVGGSVQTTCAPNPQFCFNGSLTGTFGGGLALGNSNVISIEGVLQGSITGGASLCLNPPCFGGSVVIGKIDAIVTLNLTSFYSISGSYTICNGFPPLKFGTDPCP